MYTPDRAKIFNDIETSEECDSLHCHAYRQSSDRIHSEMVCHAVSHGQCARVNQIAAEINQFIADNDDVFMYISPVGK